MSASTRQRTVTTVTMWGAVGNLALTAFKLVAGICGQSSAMVADAIHSLSDLVSDIVVVVMVRVSNKAIDKSHDYGHGKYETLATTIIAIMLLIVGCELTISGFGKIHQAMQGIPQPTPHPIALIAALFSILTKEFLYQWTNRVGTRINSPAMISNAWHHRHRRPVISRLSNRHWRRYPARWSMDSARPYHLLHHKCLYSHRSHKNDFTCHP